MELTHSGLDLIPMRLGSRQVRCGPGLGRQSSSLVPPGSDAGVEPDAEAIAMWSRRARREHEEAEVLPDEAPVIVEERGPAAAGARREVVEQAIFEPEVAR